MPILKVYFKTKLIDKFPMEIGESVTIGRQDTNNIVIDNLGVSGNHARIDSISATFILTDLESTNGTFVNEKLVSSHPLRHMDEVLIGKHKLVFDAPDLDRKYRDSTDQAEEGNPDAEELDKTQYLDTTEYWELIKKAKNDLKKK